MFSWAAIREWVRKIRGKRPVSSMDNVAREEALQLARSLSRQGVSVRGLFPGETVSEEPEIGSEPLNPPE